MKTNAIIRIVIWSIVILLLSGVLMSVLLGTFSYRNYKDHTEATHVPVREPADSGNAGFASGENTVSAEVIRDIKIEWAAGTIRIMPVAGIDEIRFREDRDRDNEYEMYSRIEGDELIIQFCKEDLSRFGLGFSIDDLDVKDLIVEVPEGWVCDTLEMDVAAVEMEIHAMTIGEVDFDGASGECRFTDCTIGQMDIDTASGDVEFSGTLNSLDFDAVSASFTGVFENVPRSIEMDSMSGDLDLTLPDYAGFTLNMDTMSGNIVSDFGYAQSRDGSYVFGDGACRIDVDGLSGKIYLRVAK